MMEQIKSVCTVNSLGSLKYYLRNNYRYDYKSRVYVSCETFITEAINRVEKIEIY